MIEFEQTLPSGDMEWHRHATAYAAIVLSGGYIERGDSGRWLVEAGDVVCHKTFAAHSNVIGQSGAQVINVELPVGVALPSVFQVAEPDELIKCAKSGSPDILHLLEPKQVKSPLSVDWPDILAAALRQAPLSLGQWSSNMRLAPATVSRGFVAAFGTTPAKYRANAQTQAALDLIVGGNAPLCNVAYQCGFADQPHMSRAIMRMTGRTPMAWRQVKTVQDRTREGL
jgi:AraC-like DNA-binding protein